MDILEMLKPWLNTDLWKHIEESKKNTRINANWGQPIED